MGLDTTKNAISTVPASDGVAAVPQKQLRLLPAIVMVALFWAFTFGQQMLEIDMGTRFFSRTIVLGVLLLAFLVWWLSRSAVSWRDRLGAVGVALLAGTAVRMVCDKSLNTFGLLFASLPWVITAWTAWLLVSRNLTPAMRRAGFCAAMLLAIGYFALVRFDGLYASQRAEMNWRWVPSAEQQFMDSRAAEHGSAPATSWTIQHGDWPEFRGVNRDGVVTDVNLATDWNAHPPKLLWRQRIGPGWSSMILVDGHLVTQEQRDQDEAVVCYDAATGKEIWAHADKVRFEETLSGAGPRGTPTFSDGRIYTLGAKGRLNCLTAATGDVVWTRDTVADAGVEASEIPQWGYSASPLVVDGLVVVFAGGKQDKSWLAYHADSGDLAWTVPGGDQSYSSAQIATIQNVRQLVLHDNRAVMGASIKDGEVLWERLSNNAMSLPMLQPHVSESNALVISGEPGMVLLEVAQVGEKWTVADRWASNILRPDFGDFVIHDGRIYGLNDGVLCCLDLATGERLWKKGRYGHCQMMLLADRSQLLLSSESGEIILLAIQPEGCEELGRFAAIEGKTWNHPVLAQDRLFLRNGEEMAGYQMEFLGTSASAPLANR